LWLLQRHPAPEQAMKLLGISESDKGKFGRAYVSTELTVRAWATSVQGDVEKATNLIWLAYQANPQDHWIASALADSMMQSRMQAAQQGLSEGDALRRILKIYPNHVNALRALWHLEESAGNVKLAESYRLRLHGISPLDAETSTAP
jgi:Tfp pilus assembly protein PilF